MLKKATDFLKVEKAVVCADLRLRVEDLLHIGEKFLTPIYILVMTGITD